MGKNIQNIGKLLLLIFSVLVYFLSIRGLPGNPSPDDLNTTKWRNDGPFEQTGRFALLYSVVEDHSFQFSLPLARFATPDLAIVDGKYVSLFPPGVAFIVMPGYLIGKYFGLAQLGTFAVVSLFAIANIFLLRGIQIKLGIHPIAATIGALVFAFATPAFAYGVDLFQHHISTFLILFSVFSLLYFQEFVALFVIWLCYGIAITVDYPNFLMLLPVCIVALIKVFAFSSNRKIFRIDFKSYRLLPLLLFFLPLLFFFWFNANSYGHPFRLSGAMQRVTTIDASGKPSNIKKTAVLPTSSNSILAKQLSVFTAFNPRFMLNGFYIHFISPDRGMLVYTPVVFFGFAGAFFAFARRAQFAHILFFIVGITILIYSMWDDPWGGWSFGSRYLIPAYAILSIFVGYLLSLFPRKNLFLFIFFMVLVYSVAVNTLGALTSSLNPPKIEADVISREAGYEFKYTYARNIDFLNNQGSKSFIFRTFGINYLSAWDYYIDLTVFILLVFVFLIVYNHVEAGKEKVK